MYDQFKHLLMTNFSNVFEDNLLTHFTASTLAGAVATTMTQPVINYFKYYYFEY